MNPGGGGEPGLGGGKRQRPLGGRWGFTDHDDVPDSAFPGAAEHAVAIGIVGRIGEVAVGVDEQEAIGYRLSASGHQAPESR